MSDLSSPTGEDDRPTCPKCGSKYGWTYRDGCYFWLLCDCKDGASPRLPSAEDREQHLEQALSDLLGMMTQWHEARHSPNRPPYMNCTNCWVWPWIERARDALGRDEPRAWVAPAAAPSPDETSDPTNDQD